MEAGKIVFGKSLTENKSKILIGPYSLTKEINRTRNYKIPDLFSTGYATNYF